MIMMYQDASLRRNVLMYCLGILVSCATATQVIPGSIRLIPCWEQMNASDVDRSGCLSQDEYFAFTKSYDADGVYTNIADASEAPAFWTTTWNNLLAVCQGNPTMDNCTEINGDCLPLLTRPPPIEITNPTELHVFYVCWSTRSALTHSKESPAPSSSPSYSPSVHPSMEPTRTPTPPPSPEPSSSPTRSPTPQPTPPPSPEPSSSPTKPPTPQPTPSPTVRPSAAPVVAITPAPVIQPSQSPSDYPTASVMPSQLPSGSPSMPPSQNPSQMPTITPVELREEASVGLAFISDDEDFRASVQSEGDDNLLQIYFSDAIAAMNELWIGMNLGRRRNLARSISTPCQMESQTTALCPDEFSLPSTVCRNVVFVCFLTLAGDEAELSSSVSQNVRASWENEILGEGYQRNLDIIRSGAGGRIVVLSTQSFNSSNQTQKGATLTTAVTGSVVSGAILLVMLPFMLLLFRRSRSQGDQKQKVFYEPYDPSDDAPNELEPDIDSTIYATHVNPSRGKPMLGASKPSYVAKSTQKFLDDVERGEDILAEPEFDAERDSSSNAGSSGWSSSAGYSSYNTGSMDDSMDAAMAAGTTLAAIGVTSSLSNQLSNQMNESRASDGPASRSVSSSSASASRDQLDSLIEAGDWAAVGTTAALLAAQSESQSLSSTSRSRRSRTSSFGSDSVEAQRAAELDNLVDAGDWEGVVLAAARFETTEMTVSSRGSRTASSVDSTGSHTQTDDDGIATTSSPSQSESATGTESMDDPSRVRQRKEIRAEVEALVRRVVPEEIDNVDEMMNQFKGREEELVETLRTMQERNIAQKARSAGHKTAKLEARKNVKRGMVPGARLPPRQIPRSNAPPPVPKQEATSAPIAAPAAPAVSEAAAEAEQPTNVPQTTSSGTMSVGNESSTLGSLQETRRSLDRAIDAGDWEAVGQAAAFLSDGSVATNETGGEIERTTVSNLSTVSSGISQTRQAKDNATAIRAAELDEMINKGDWNGVMEAAQRFSQMDKNTDSEMGRTAEEEEALKQAEFWTSIANQKKAQGANDVGASDAAEWAIQRSLSQMKEADKKKDVSVPKKGDEDEV